MTFRILTAEISHETNTFSIRPTTFASFTDRSFLLGRQAIAARGVANTDLAGFLDVGRARGWQITHSVSTSAPPGGRVTADAFARITAPLLEQAALGPWDGILLSLHGAMVTTDSEDGEGTLLALIRGIVGPKLPVAITLDPHANATQAMCRHANIIVSYKTYPHVDMRERARQAADILHRAMTGEIAPYTLRAHRPMLEEVNGGRTDVGPMIDRLARGRAHEAHPDAFAVSVNGGFGNADIAEVGPTVLVTCQGDPVPHQALADSIADDIWARRSEGMTEFHDVATAAARAYAHDGKGGPIVVADYADNPGGGGYGDSTSLLAALLKADVTDACFGPMVDEAAVAFLHTLAVGDTVTLALGGRTDPAKGGGPLTVTGRIALLSGGDFTGDGPMMGGLAGSWGKMAVLVVAGVDILVVTKAQQILDLQQFRAFGIDPTAKSVVAVKSMQHFRAAFAPIAAEMILCDSGALCSPDLRKLPYRQVPRPIFPLDQSEDEYR